MPVLFCQYRGFTVRKVFEVALKRLPKRQRDPSLHYVIVGMGPEERFLASRAKDFNLADRIHFVGEVSRTEIAAYYSAGDIFLFSTRRIEVGITINILEALAAGLPVLASEHIAYAHLELIAINPEDIFAMSQWILSTPARQDRSSRLPDEFTLDFTARTYLQLFDERLR